jgi:hypothetical protein
MNYSLHKRTLSVQNRHKNVVFKMLIEINVLFFIAKGRKAYKNRQTIKRSRQRTGESCVTNTGWPYIESFLDEQRVVDTEAMELTAPQ